MTTISDFLQRIADSTPAVEPDAKRAVEIAKAQETCKRCRTTFYGDKSVLSESGHCSDCQKCIDRGYDIQSKAGRCVNGGERDRGIVFHAIMLENENDAFDYMSDKAVCGTAPGKRSVGWSSWKPEDRVVTCERCLARLKRMGNDG